MILPPILALSVGVSTHSYDPEQAPQFKSLGIEVARTDIAWSHVIQSDGEYWERTDKFYHTMMLWHIRSLFIVQWDNPDKPLTTLTGQSAYADFVSQVHRRYPTAILELLNEPNREEHGYIQPEIYVDAVRAVRSVAPEAVLLGPALGGPELDVEWLERFAFAGGEQWLDAISVHPYGAGDPSGLPAYLQRVRAHITKQIVISEWGFLDTTGNQAELVFRALKVSKNMGIPLTVIYCWKDYPSNPFGLVDERGMLKPSAYAVQTFTAIDRR